MNYQIYNFSAQNEKWLAKSLDIGKQICSKLEFKQPDASDANYLDQVFMRLAQSPDLHGFTPADIADGLGAMFGDLLARQLNFYWKIIEDDLGKEIAMIEESTGSIVFPVNALLKRLEPTIYQDAFFVPMFDAIKKHMRGKK